MFLGEKRIVQCVAISEGEAANNGRLKGFNSILDEIENVFGLEMIDSHDAVFVAHQFSSDGRRLSPGAEVIKRGPKICFATTETNVYAETCTWRCVDIPRGNKFVEGKIGFDDTRGASMKTRAIGPFFQARFAADIEKQGVH